MFFTMRGKETAIEAITAALVVKAIRSPNIRNSHAPNNPCFPRSRRRRYPVVTGGMTSGRLTAPSRNVLPRIGLRVSRRTTTRAPGRFRRVDTVPTDTERRIADRSSGENIDEYPKINRPVKSRTVHKAVPPRGS